MPNDGKRKWPLGESSSSGESSDGADARAKSAKPNGSTRNFIPTKMLYGDKMEIVPTESTNDVGSRTKHVQANDAQSRHQKSMSMSSTDSSGNREKNGSGQEGDSEGEDDEARKMHRLIIAAKKSKFSKKEITKKETAMDEAEKAAIEVLSKLHLGNSNS